MADLAVRNNIHVNLNSHEESNDNSIFKFFYSKDLSNYKLMLVTEAYNDIKEGKEVYFLDSFNKPARVKSIIKEKYNGKIYDVEKGKLEWQLPMEYQEFGYNNGYV